MRLFLLVGFGLLTLANAQLTCRDVNVGKTNGDGTDDKNVNNVGTIQTIEFLEYRGQGEGCEEGVSFGILDANTVWTSNNCKGSFSVCGGDVTDVVQDIVTDVVGDGTAPVNLELTCRNVNVGKTNGAGTDDKEVKNVGTIQTIQFREYKGQGEGCEEGVTFGILDAKTVWTSDNCKGSFIVCGDQDSVVGNFAEEGEEDVTVEEILTRLGNKKKDKYDNKCKCTAWGDPHFDGFDGGVIHYMGICEYTLVKTLAGFGECAFDITVENEERDGVEGVSFVKAVNIILAGHSIRLGKDNTLTVDGNAEALPYALNGIFEVEAPCLNNIIFNADGCDLEVSFKDNHKVEVLTSQTYAGRMKGLCGNCNGEEADDFLLANGDAPTGSNKEQRAQIGQSWQVPIYRDGLPAVCEGTTPHEEPEAECDAQTTDAAMEQCEPMLGETGPFRNCFHDVDAASKQELREMYAGCVNDLCVFANDDDKFNQLRCRALQSLADACAEKGQFVDFHDELNCASRCPTGFEFSNLVPRNQPSCQDKEPRNRPRKDDFTTGCMCELGLFLDGDKCVEETECGCQRGRHYLAQGEVKLSNNCRKKYTCELEEGETVPTLMTDSSHRCGDNSHCAREDGLRVCKCNRNFKEVDGVCVPDPEQEEEEEAIEDEDRETRNDEMCTCNPWGDPHYIGYDGDSIHFQGACTYVVSETVGVTDHCAFSVLAQNEFRNGKTHVAFTKEVYVITRGLTIELRKGREVAVNGEVKQLPYQNSDKGITIDSNGRYVEVVTACNVQVSFSGDDRMYVRIPKAQFGDKVVGLCSDCDGVRGEFVTRDGEQVGNDGQGAMLIGNSWRVNNPVGNPEHPSCPQVEPEPECTEEQTTAALTPEECGRIMDVQGPFAECLAELGVAHPQIAELVEGCRIDFCSFEDTEAWEDMRCTVNEEMAALCIKNGISVNWRTPDFCSPPECPANSVYKPRMSGCQPTCARPTRRTRCNREEVEGCECLEGFVMDGGSCISLEDCGCVDHNGDYIPRGSKFISEDCTTTFTCEAADEGSILTSEAVDHGQCHVQATCIINRQHQPDCRCNEGFTGDGYTCEPIPPRPSPSPPTPSPSPPTPTEPPCVCKANGDPRVVQFDQGRLWVNRPCKYTLAKSSPGEQNCRFEVSMKTVAHTIHPHMSYIYEVDIKLAGHTTIRIGQNLVVGIKDNLFQNFIMVPVVDTFQVSEDTRLVLDAGGLTVVNSCGLEVKFDGLGEVTVTVPATNDVANMKGLCGNCDGNLNNDRTALSGKRPFQFPTLTDGHNEVSRRFMVTDDSSVPELSSILCPVPE